MDTAATLVETVQSLWPNADAAPARSRTADRAAVAEFAVVPNLRSARLLVPAHDAAAAARALWRFNAAASTRETLARTVASGAVRAGGVAAFGERIRLYGRFDGSLAEHLSGLLGESVVFSLGIGTARVNRKPVLQVFGDRGRSLGFAKLGNSPQARLDVDAEAGALGVLTGRAWESLSTPRLLHHGTWSGMALLVMSALPTSPWQRSRDQWRLPGAAMAELANAFAEESRPLAELAWFQRQRAVASGLGDARVAERLTEALDTVLDLAAGRPWDVGAWHGDWTPWNMARRGRHVQLWDWERFERGVPRGLDAFHYCVNAVTRRDGTSPETIVAGLELAGAARRAHTRAHLLAALYLLAAAGRYLPLTGAEEGRHIQGRAEATLDALRAWLRGS